MIYLITGMVCLVFAITSCQGQSTPKLGEELIKQRCTACHTTKRIYSTTRSPQEWDVIIERMIRHGARLRPGDKENIISFLTK